MIKELLKQGRENAITSVQLINDCGFSSKRELTDQIQKERTAGAVICSTTSGGGGYYLPKDREELIRFIKSMESRAKTINRSISAACAQLKDLEGQQSLDFGDKMK